MSKTPARQVENPDHQVGYALEGIRFPQDRAGVIAAAEANGADAEAFSYLNQIPEGEYNSIPQILAAAGDGRSKDKDADAKDD